MNKLKQISKYFWVLLIGSLLFSWWFATAGPNLCGIVGSFPYPTMQAPGPEIDKLKDDVAVMDRSLHEIADRERVIFLYIIFVSVVFGHFLFRSNREIFTGSEHTAPR